MKTLKIRYPVYTLDKKQILLKNTQNVTKDLIDLISSSRPVTHKRYSLLKYNPAKKDLVNLMEKPNYEIIFASREKRSEILSILGRVPLIPPILESFDYFKHHDPYTYRHTLIVFALSSSLSMELLPGSNASKIKMLAGPTHDFGKICVPVNILRNSSLLTRTQMGILEHHAAAGYVLLSYHYRDIHNSFAKVARDHHERKNGAGYPRGIKLKDLIVEIVAASDVYDALISPRPYRPIPYDNRTALEEITIMAERNQLSWKVVRALIACNRKSKPLYKTCKISREKRGEPPPQNKYGIFAKEKD